MAQARQSLEFEKRRQSFLIAAWKIPEVFNKQESTPSNFPTSGKCLHFLADFLQWLYFTFQGSMQLALGYFSSKFQGPHSRSGQTEAVSTAVNLN